jgi:hypothetical protein
MLVVAGGVPEVIDPWPSEFKDLSSNPSTTSK